MQLNKNQEKVDFLEVFFNSIRGLEYGVIDIDNNLERDVKNDIDIWVSQSSIKDLVDQIKLIAASKGWLIKKMNVSPRIGPAAEGKYALVFINNLEIVIQLDLWVRFHWRGVPFTNRNQVGIISWISSVINTLFIYKLMFVFLSGSNKSKGA